jgi:hypothetical protein
MNILMGLVIAMFVIVGGYVGYHASQEIMNEEAEGHDIIAELEILNKNAGLIETLQYHEIRKSII